MAQKQIVFTPKSLGLWHHSIAHTFCPSHLHFIDAQSLWKNNGRHWKHPRGSPAIVLSFEDDCP